LVEDDRFFTGGQGLRALSKPLRRSSPPAPDGIHVWVSHIDGEAVRDGLDGNRVKAEVEWRLAAAGIPVRHQQAGPGKTPAAPCLGVLLNLRQADVVPSCYIFSVEVFCVQTNSSDDDHSTRNLHMSWCQEAIGDARKTPQGPDWSSVYAQIGFLVEAFIASYLTANPQAKPALLIN
jgi:hypothetical protein